MARVNYIKECRAFIALSAEERLSANEFVLWHALFELFNRKANNDEWPDGFVQISNAKLLPMTTFGVGDSGCETLRKTREKLQARGLIKYRKGRRNALTPAYCMCYFFAEKSEAADSAENPMAVRAQDTNPERRTGKLLGKPLGRPLGKELVNPLGNPLGKPLAKTLDIPLNVNPNVVQKKLISSGGTNTRAKAVMANRQPDDEKITTTRHGTGMAYDCAEQIGQTSAAAYNSAWKTSARDGGQRQARPVGDSASRQPNVARSIPTELGAGKGCDYAELRNVAQRLLDQYDGLMDSSVAWESLCEVMADGLSPEAIEAAMPTRSTFSKLIARLRALTSCKLHGYPVCSGNQGDARLP